MRKSKLTFAEKLLCPFVDLPLQVSFSTRGLRKFFFVFLFSFFFHAVSVFSEEASSYLLPKIPVFTGTAILQKAYPDLSFEVLRDGRSRDWIVTVLFPSDKVSFFWAGGRMLPESERENIEKYWPLFYRYEDLRDPESLSEEERERIREFASNDNRKNGSGTPMFFFEALYGAETRASLEQNLVRIDFLGCKTTVHKRISEPLARVEEKIITLSKTDKETAAFVEEIKSADAYSWRQIVGTKRKSFHSMGVAIDILPKKLNGKQIFWSWARDKNPKNWMLTPLSQRWMPPEKVIKIFEDEGFIWGGKWVIFDNMHFEYHPELILYSRKK